MLFTIQLESSHPETPSPTKSLRVVSLFYLTMQSRISPDNWQKFSGLGTYQSILNRAVLQICKIGYFSMIEGSFTDFTSLYTVLKLEQMVSGVLEQ